MGQDCDMRGKLIFLFLFRLNCEQLSSYLFPFFQKKKKIGYLLFNILSLNLLDLILGVYSNFETSFISYEFTLLSIIVTF